MDASGNGRRARAPRTGLRTATLLCAAAALAATVVAPASAQSTQSARNTAVRAPEPEVLVVVDCSSQAQVRPGEYVLACGDGNNQLIGLDWENWGPKTATATGTDMVNDCRPYCAAGRFRPHPVTVTLANPRPWPGHPGVHRFTTVRLLYTHTTPGPVPHDVTYKLVY
ncbi:hypothetical protein AB0P12_26550 [Streptomyces subrutilus]|uniref:hypothetical protein n=1 Tax=Streptomyces subrutilus TaxID=36818 RepID=UPI0034352492